MKSRTLRVSEVNSANLAVKGIIMVVAEINALNIALYGMFIAIIVPPARKKKPVLFTVLFAVLLSCCFAYFPVFSGLSGGWGIIIITIVVSAVAALLFPVEEEEANE